ncbi:MAG: biopolymer transport protein ExbD [Candidatus Sericytochromatia bacterium]|nr:MAG: biopolymer transport protein ExbD [Candidatus Sericytochromatia bacterium]
MRRNKREKLYFEVIPLIDIMMVLVLFFSVASFIPYSKNLIKAHLPKSENNNKAENNVSFIVSIDKNKVIKFNNKIVSINELKDILKSKEYIDKTILLAADKELQYQDIIKFLDILKQTGNEKVGLLTE